MSHSDYSTTEMLSPCFKHICLEMYDTVAWTQKYTTMDVWNNYCYRGSGQQSVGFAICTRQALHDRTE